VDSAIIAIKNISRENFNSPIEEYPTLVGGGGYPPHLVSEPPLNEGNKFEERFWEIVKAGFAHKRKKLSSNLKNLAKEGSKASFLELGNKRAEDLSLADWLALAK
jgi:16S rRNA A1518/A1519 N6-dimethyltransferase RsmA/KsgA/DIM1 with predicted DNA glycosylase/AP lyase activity